MSQNNVSYPYPVLTVYGDDILPSLPEENLIFENDEFGDDGLNHVVSFSLQLNNDCIQQYIENGLAEYVVEISCPTTLYKRCLKQNSPKFNITIPKNEVNGKTTFSSFVLAKDSFKYFNPDAHQDYNGEQFEIERGDVLVEFNQFYHNFDIDYSKIKAYSSIMTIKKSPKKDSKRIEYDTNSDKIAILLPEEMYMQYLHLKNCNLFTPAIHASLVQNALLYTLLTWKDDEDEDRLWKRTIQYRLEHEPELKEFTLDPENVIDLVHALLDNPSQRMFNAFIELEEQLTEVKNEP